MNPRPLMVNAFDPSSADDLDEATRDKIRRRSDVLGPGYQLFYQRPLEVVRGLGTHLFDADGRDYLDVYNNVPSVGHCHPHVVEAVGRQLTTVNTNTRYLQDALVTYAERLTATFPAELSKVTFACTGSEANDLALRVARYATGNQGVIVTASAYHGLTAEVAAFSPSLGPGSDLGVHVRVISAPDARLAPDGDVAAMMDRQMAAAIEDLQRHGLGVAAFYADSIFSSDGVFADPTGFLAPAVQRVHDAGGLYVADEVQPGFTRLGTTWWGFQRHGVVPDIVTLGKPMGNGIPISAAVFRPEVAESFGRNVRYFNTFGGSSVPIAAASAVMDVIEQEDLMAGAARVGAVLKDGLDTIVSDNPFVAEVRGAGLFIGVDISDVDGSPDAGRAGGIVNDLRERGVLISASGPGGNVLKVRPPLVFDEADAARFLEAFEASADSVLR
jgi:4-aminobutyrate aminotransferase-like enzyme